MPAARRPPACQPALTAGLRGWLPRPRSSSLHPYSTFAPAVGVAPAARRLVVVGMSRPALRRRSPRALADFGRRGLLRRLPRGRLRSQPSPRVAAQLRGRRRPPGLLGDLHPHPRGLAWGGGPRVATRAPSGLFGRPHLRRSLPAPASASPCSVAPDRLGPSMLCLTRRPVVRSAPTAPSLWRSLLHPSPRGAWWRRSVRASPPGCPARGLRCVRSLHRRSRGRRSRRRLRGGQGLIAPRPCRPPWLPTARRRPPGPSPRRGRPRRRQGRLRRCRLPHRRPRPAPRPPLRVGLFRCLGARRPLGRRAAETSRRPPPHPLASGAGAVGALPGALVAGRGPLPSRARPTCLRSPLAARSGALTPWVRRGGSRAPPALTGRARSAGASSFGFASQVREGRRPKPPARPEGPEACSGRGASLVRR